MKSYGVAVRNRETKEWWLTDIQGEAKSRRAFIKANAEKIRPFRTGHQFRVGTIA